MDATRISLFQLVQFAQKTHNNTVFQAKAEDFFIHPHRSGHWAHPTGYFPLDSGDKTAET
jgi:hypothetical protein